MAGVDKIAGTNNESDIDAGINNGVGVGAITPALHNQLLEDVLKTAFFANAMKFTIKQSGVPSAGEISLNGDNFDTATHILISKTDDHANNISLALGLVIKDYVIQLKDYGANFGEFTVSAISDAGTYIDFTVVASGSNPSYSPTGLEGMLRIFTKNDTYSGIYGGSGSLVGATTVTMASYLLNFLGTTNAIQIKDGVLTSASAAQNVYLDGANNKLASQNTTIGHGEHELVFQDNPSPTGITCTLPLESGVIIVIPQANTIIANPTVSEDGYAIVWDNTAGEYTLAPN